ncbi:unnamed protein product [Closterium sp. Yama58-4]|nr:unnamed protein product [Closterium sp. Yama58-4]
MAGWDVEQERASDVLEEAIPQSDMAGGNPPASNRAPNATYSSVPQNVTTRVAFVLIDGIGDVAVPSLGGLTPLEAAHTPNLDAIAAAGVNGLMDPVEPGLACGSDTAHLSLLGYNPRHHYRGRGAFESMGAGIPMQPGDIAFKSNFAVLDEASGIVVKRRADRHFEEEGPILCRHLDGLKIPGFPDYQVSIKYATEHRCGVVVRGPGLSDKISGTDPLKDGRALGVATPLDGSPEADLTACVVNALSDAIPAELKNHPINAQRAAQGKNVANVVLLRGCGIRIEGFSSRILPHTSTSLQVPTFKDRHGMRACMVAPTKIIAGLGLSLGIDILHVPAATGDYRTCLASKAEAVAAALSTVPPPLPPSKTKPTNQTDQNGRIDPIAPLIQSAPLISVPGEDDPREGCGEGYEFAFLHIKAVDDAGHDKAVDLKVRALEAVDRMVGQLAHRLWLVQREGEREEEQQQQRLRFCLCVTGDHSTPILYGDHAEDPVPLAICDLSDFIHAVPGGEAAVLGTDLSPFPIPTAATVAAAEGVSGANGGVGEGKGDGGKEEGVETVPGVAGSLAGDGVSRFSESAAAKGSLGRFPGSEMMRIIKWWSGRGY